MKNPIVIVAVLVVLVIGGVVAARQLDKGSDTDSNTDSNMKDMGNMDASDSSSDMNAEMDLTGQSEVAIDIQDFDFQKSNIKITEGTKVTWTNKDSAKHDVANDGAGVETMDSELLGMGENFSYTFTKIGVTNYKCTPHPYMKGIINVVAKS